MVTRVDSGEQTRTQRGKGRLQTESARTTGGKAGSWRSRAPLRPSPEGCWERHVREAENREDVTEANRLHRRMRCGSCCVRSPNTVKREPGLQRPVDATLPGWFSDGRNKESTVLSAQTKTKSLFRITCQLLPLRPFAVVT